MPIIAKISAALILLIASINLNGQTTISPAAKVEIYLIKKLNNTDSFPAIIDSHYFSPTKEDLADTAFIRDDEILGYVIYEDTIQKIISKLYGLLLTTSGQQKINMLKNITMWCGKKYAIVLNGEPLFGAYFWSRASSFQCTWVVSYAYYKDELTLRKAMPSRFWDNSKEDPRGNPALLNALKSTGRLFIR